MEVGTKLVADTKKALELGLMCGVLVDGQVYTIKDINEHGACFFILEEIGAHHAWSLYPDEDGHNYELFFKLLEV